MCGLDLAYYDHDDHVSNDDLDAAQASAKDDWQGSMLIYVLPLCCSDSVTHVELLLKAQRQCFLVTVLKTLYAYQQSCKARRLTCI